MKKAKHYGGEKKRENEEREQMLRTPRWNRPSSRNKAVRQREIKWKAEVELKDHTNYFALLSSSHLSDLSPGDS